MSRAEFALAATSALAVMVFDVLIGVLVAVGLSLLMALGRIATPHDAILGAGQDLDGWVDAEAHPGSRTLPGLLVYRFDAPLFFANANRYRERLELLVEENPGEEEWLVLDFEGVGEADTTAVDMLVELLAEHRGAGRRRHRPRQRPGPATARTRRVAGSRWSGDRVPDDQRRGPCVPQSTDLTTGTFRGR